MKQDRIDRLIEITGQIPESYVAEALPQSLRETLSSDVLTEAPKEKRTMKTSIAHYIAGGFAAAAAIGVLVGGGLLISTLNRKPERPADSGTDTTTVSTVTTENTLTTTTTVDGSADTVRIGDFDLLKHDVFAEVIGISADAAEQAEIPAEADGLPVTHIGEGACKDSTSLINITIPASVNTVGRKAFADCAKLEAVTFLGDSAEIADDAFADCDSKKLVLRGGAGIEAYARAHGFDYEPLDGTQPGDGDQADSSYQYYHFVDGKPVASDFFSNNSDYHKDVISDGTYYYSTKNNSLYRRDNDQLILTVENPRQYLTGEDVKGKETWVDYRSIVAVGDRWYFVSAMVGFESSGDNSAQMRYLEQKHLLLWVDRQTGKVQKCQIPTTAVYDVLEGTEGYDPRNYGHADPSEEYEIGTMLWQADPDGNAVYASDSTEQLVIRMPVPGAGEIKAWYVKHEQGQLMTNFFAPIGNGKVLVLVNGQNMSLYELSTADGSMKLLNENYNGHDIRNHHGRILSSGYNASNGKAELIEYFPAAGKTGTVAALGTDASMLFADYAEDAVILTAMYEAAHNDGQPDLLVSLKDGKVTELK